MSVPPPTTTTNTSTQYKPSPPKHTNPPPTQKQEPRAAARLIQSKLTDDVGKILRVADGMEGAAAGTAEGAGGLPPLPGPIREVMDAVVSVAVEDGVLFAALGMIRRAVLEVARVLLSPEAWVRVFCWDVRIYVC